MCISAAVIAAPFGVQLGPDRLTIDTPAGFADTAGFGSPRLTEIAETMADPGSRVLVFALSDSDARRFAAGDALELRRYLLASTPRARERERMTAAQFAEIVAEIERNIDPAFSSPENYRPYLMERPAGQAHLLAKLRRDAQVINLLYGTMIPQPPPKFWREAPPPSYKLTSTAVALIGGRAVYVSAFSTYESPADVIWTRSITESWVQELQRLNK